ncbi:MAG: tetratricopeptide repeat protein, partial [Wenzhouxiangella sp.]|nr:tetratricopeptide repeat protein [Wenzhouxiangella sp.]
LDQDPLISGGVIFDRSIIERLRGAGFDNAVGEPLALSLRLAAENASDFLIRGRVAKTEEGYRLEADLYEVENGNLMETVRAEGSTLIAAADLLAGQVGERLVGDLDRGDAPFRPVSLEERTSRDPAVLEPFIRGVKALIIDTDFDEAIAFLDSAVEIDPTFAQGWAWLQQVHRTVGNMPAANAATNQALAHDYKLSTQLRFVLRANQYAIGGDVDRAIRVLRMWTEVEPHSLEAWMSLTRNLLLVGEIDEARSANEAAKAIDPDRPSLDRTRANIEELAGNFELASEILEGYLDAEPQDAAAWISLGNVRERAGDSDGAREAYERAGFVASNDFQARERLLRLDARAGDPLQAVRDFRRALEQPLQPSEETSLVSQFVFLLLNLGRIDEVLELIDNHEAAFAQTMAPMSKTLTLEGLRAGALTTVGRFDEVLERLDRAEEGMAGPFGALFAHARVPILVETNRLDEARAAIDRLRALVETAGMIGQDALLELAAAQVEAAEGDYEAALARLDEADGRLHGTTMSLMAEVTEPIALRFAEYEIELDRTESALRRLDDLLAKHPNSTSAQLLRARALKAMQQDDEAREQLDELMDLLADADADFEVSLEADELYRGILAASESGG